MDQYFRWFGLPGSVVLTGLMSALALVLAVLQPTAARWVCFAAMFLSSIGDVFLARFAGLDRIFPNYFVIGAGFFMAAHLVYLLCFCLKIKAAGAHFFNAGAVAAMVLGVAIALLMVILAIRTGNTGILPLILVYALIITCNCCGIFSWVCSQWQQHPAALFTGLGVVSFLLSDLVIGLGIAGNIHRFDHLIWWLYPIGQILLILGA